MNTSAPRSRRLRHWAGSCLMPILRQAAHSYVAGEHLQDALKIAQQFAAQHHPVTIGYFNSDEQSPSAVAMQYLSAIAAMKGTDNFLSIKLPALHYSWDLTSEVACTARQAGLRLHFDALEPDSVDRTWKMVDRLLQEPSPPRISVTLPGRWRRSITDTQWAVDRGLMVRVVKGQWANPNESELNLREGFLRVIDALAGRASHVAIASHDVPMMLQAVQRLRDASTLCELELLYGLPMRPSLAAARYLYLPVRIYIPYGTSVLPYAINRISHNPRLAWWLLKDFISSFLSFSPMH